MNPIPHTKVNQYYDIYEIKESTSVKSTSFSFEAFSMFKKLSKDAHIIHCQYPNPFSDLLYLLSGNNKPLLVTYQSDIIRQSILKFFYKPIENIFLGKAKKIITTSENYFKSSDNLQKYKEKINIIPICFDYKKYNDLEQNRLKAWKDKLPNKFFLFVGSFRYYKGLDYLVDSVLGKDINLVLIGNGEKYEQIKEKVYTTGANNIYILNDVSEIDKIHIIHCCYGFVFPSNIRTEAYGISLLEAAACGKPMITAEINTGTTFINLHNKTGLVVKKSNTNELTNAMNTLLNDEKLTKKFGSNAKERILREFDFDAYIRSYISCYAEICET